jgi:hypothetical protein
MVRWGLQTIVAISEEQQRPVGWKAVASSKFVGLIRRAVVPLLALSPHGG